MHEDEFPFVLVRVLGFMAFPVVLMAAWLIKLLRELPDRSFWWSVFIMATLMALPFVKEFAVANGDHQIGPHTSVNRLPVPTSVIVREDGISTKQMCLCRSVSAPVFALGNHVVDPVQIAVASVDAALITIVVLLPVCLSARHSRSKHLRSLAARQGPGGR